jgi:hypothetical protein
VAQEGTDIHPKNGTGCQPAELICALHMVVFAMREEVTAGET